VIIKATSPSDNPARERHTLPTASRIRYGFTNRNNRPSSSLFVKEIVEPLRDARLPQALVRYESLTLLSSRRAFGGLTHVILGEFRRAELQLGRSSILIRGL
jgi:hypothetical protein